MYSRQAKDLPTQMLAALPRTPRSLCIRHAILSVHQIPLDRELVVSSVTTLICPITSLHLREVENIKLFNIRGNVPVTLSKQVLPWLSSRVEVDADGAQESPSSFSLPVGMLIQYGERLESLYIGRHTHVLHEISLLKEIYMDSRANLDPRPGHAISTSRQVWYTHFPGD